MDGQLKGTILNWKVKTFSIMVLIEDYVFKGNTDFYGGTNARVPQKGKGTE